MTTITQARDAIAGIINTAWLASPTTSSLTLLWDNVKGDPPAEDGSTGKAEAWGRVAVRHTIGENDTLGPIGGRRYLFGGTVTVQLFAPIGDGHSQLDEMVEVVKAALQEASPSAAVWFFDITPVEIGPDGPWFNTNVDALFRYQQRA